MNEFEFNSQKLADTASESVLNKGVEEARLETRLAELRKQLTAVAGEARSRARIELEISRVLVDLDRGPEAWEPGRDAFTLFLDSGDWEDAADACAVLSRSNQEAALSALGQGIWLAVTCPVDPELSMQLLHQVVDETPADSDGAAVAAATALFLVDLRSEGPKRERLKFFAAQTLGAVARRHSEIETQPAFDHWMERLELNDPDRFLPRLRNVVDVLVQDDWWFDREALQARLPVN